VSKGLISNFVGKDIQLNYGRFLEWHRRTWKHVTCQPGTSIYHPHALTPRCPISIVGLPDGPLVLQEKHTTDFSSPTDISSPSSQDSTDGFMLFKCIESIDSSCSSWPAEPEKRTAPLAVRRASPADPCIPDVLGNLCQGTSPSKLWYGQHPGEDEARADSLWAELFGTECPPAQACCYELASSLMQARQGAEESVTQWTPTPERRAGFCATRGPLSGPPPAAPWPERAAGAGADDESAAALQRSYPFFLSLSGPLSGIPRDSRYRGTQKEPAGCWEERGPDNLGRTTVCRLSGERPGLRP
jgi:hypothetical protein